LGFLRIILAIAVVIAHSDDFFGIKMTGGVIAVQLFFIISGFYMSLILSEKYIGPGSYKLFITNRALKIFPIYWVMLILTLLVSCAALILINKSGVLLPYIEYGHSIPIEGIILQVISNVIILGQDIFLFIGVDISAESLYFTPNFGLSEPPFYKFLILPQAWTLSLELMFYLLAPFLVRFSTKKILLLLSISLILRFSAYYFFSMDQDPWTYRFFPFEIALFLMGFLSYRLYKKMDEKKYWDLKYGGIISITFIIFIIFIEFFPINKWVLYSVFSCFFLPLLFSKSKGLKFDTKVGELSFPIYICHLLVIMLITPALSIIGLEQWRGETSVVFSILLSIFLVKYLSVPLENYRRKRFLLKMDNNNRGKDVNSKMEINLGKVEQ
jgi:peptidoglycan/LPS O-acetylase OafA/YrhL